MVTLAVIIMAVVISDNDKCSNSGGNGNNSSDCTGDSNIEAVALTEGQSNCIIDGSGSSNSR